MPFSAFTPLQLTHPDLHDEVLDKNEHCNAQLKQSPAQYDPALNKVEWSGREIQAED